MKANDLAKALIADDDNHAVVNLCIGYVEANRLAREIISEIQRRGNHEDAVGSIADAIMEIFQHRCLDIADCEQFNERTEIFLEF